MKWQKIKGFENYEVSDCGHVRNARNKKIRKLQKNKKGYWKVTFSKDGKQLKRTVSKLVAAAFIPNPDNLEYVTYKDADNNNLYADNLQRISHKETTEIYMKRNWYVVGYN